MKATRIFQGSGELSEIWEVSDDKQSALVKISADGLHIVPRSISSKGKVLVHEKIIQTWGEILTKAEGQQLLPLK